MNFNQYFVLLLISITSAYPSAEPTDDYVEIMADIFDIPMDDGHRPNLQDCSHIICMPHYLCINDMIVTNGTELFEYRILPRIDAVVCDDDMEMPCCADEAMKNQQNQSPDDVSESNELSDKDEFVNSNENDIDGSPAPMLCGHRNGKPLARIMDGDEAQPNEFPWMVGVFLRLPNDNLRYIGGGSLIHPSVILTAAHLIQRIDANRLIVRAGDHNLLDDEPKRQERNVSNIIIHNDIYVKSLINNIAMLVIDEPFAIGDAVNTICLPPQSVEIAVPTAMCTSSGWGKNSTDSHGAYQATLKKIDLPMIERKKCQHLLRRTRLGPFYDLPESLLCAGGGHRDTCKGDGGSPLFCEIPHANGRFYQSGIVAGGIGCGGNVPGLYVNVAHFTNWIIHQLGFMNLNFAPENLISFDLFEWKRAFGSYREDFNVWNCEYSTPMQSFKL